MTLAEVAEVTAGRLDQADDPQARVTADVVVDSRQVSRGGLFVALPGEHVDGHDYAAAAVAAGAVAVLAARPVDVPAVVVADPQRALGALAKVVRSQLSEVDVVGITGSQGKTGTKDLVAQLLSTRGELVAPPGSYNNEIGLPLTVLEATSSTRSLVLEMGARGHGHIAYLADIGRPRIGVVLNVGVAHIGEFGDREAIARAKGELVEALPAAADGGVAILNGDDALVRGMAERTEASVLMFGESVHADVRAEDVRLDERGRATFTLVTQDASVPVALQLYGEHHVSNALAAAATALTLGLSAEQAAAGLSEAAPLSKWRMQVDDRPDGVTVVNDAYNANPDSVCAALTALVAMGRGRRTWAVLGEMRELGATSAEEHDAVGRLAVRLDVNRLVAVGEGARAVHMGAAHEGSWGDESTYVPDTASAIALLRQELRPGDVVLVKASRAAGLDVVAEALLSDTVGVEDAR
jgi:UDP-N-acetylmuramoyl-tripeptide--D-alanyl-D-alanine ligase